jgi:hypothetical protein
MREGCTGVTMIYEWYRYFVTFKRYGNLMNFEKYQNLMNFET